LKSVLLLALATSATAAPFEWWQTTDIALFNREKVTAVVHTQLRVRQRFHDVFQGRIGSVVRFSLPRRWSLSTGYYYSEVEAGPHDWRNNHRAWVSVDRPFRFERGTFSLRTMAEHHWGGSNPRDNRLRQQFMWTHQTWMSPYAGSETFFNREGFMGQRLLAGVRRSLTSGYMIDLGYIYDRRQLHAGGTRHVFQTAIRPRRRER
jgi:hypothetical protein